MGPPEVNMEVDPPLEVNTGVDLPGSEHGSGSPRSEHGSGPPRSEHGSGPPRSEHGSGPPRSEQGSGPPQEVDAEEVVEEDQLRSTAGQAGSMP